jgi:hypothetical protein
MAASMERRGAEILYQIAALKLTNWIVSDVYRAPRIIRDSLNTLVSILQLDHAIGAPEKVTQEVIRR